MARAKRLLADGEHALENLLGFPVAIQRLHDAADDEQPGRHLRVVSAERFFEDRLRPPVQLRRLLVAALVLVGDREIADRPRHLDVVRALHQFQDRDRALVQRLRLHVLAAAARPRRRDR